MDEDTSTNDPAGAQAIDMPPGSAVSRTGTPPNISFASLQTKPSRGIASPAPDPPSAAWFRTLPRGPTSRPAMELSTEHLMVDEKFQAPKKRRSIGDFATQVVKNPRETFKRLRRPKSTTTIATSPPPVEVASPEASRSDKPEENPPEPQPRTRWIDPSDMEGPVEDEKNKDLLMRRPPGAPQLSNLAAFFWSRLELAHSLFLERRLDECRDLILRTLEKARVPRACRCQLLQQLAVIEPFQQGMECLDEADELCRQMQSLVPYSEEVYHLENKTSRLRQLMNERQEAIGEDEEMAEDNDSSSEEDEMTMDDDKAIGEDEEMIMDDDDIEAGEEPKESQSVQQQSDHEMEEEGLGEISKIAKLNLHGTAEDTLSSLPENALPHRRRRTERTSVRRGLPTPEPSMREDEDEADQGQADMQ